jgi:hypothetical protein
MVAVSALLARIMGFLFPGSDRARPLPRFDHKVAHANASLGEAPDARSKRLASEHEARRVKALFASEQGAAREGQTVSSTGPSSSLGEAPDARSKQLASEHEARRVKALFALEQDTPNAATDEGQAASSNSPSLPAASATLRYHTQPTVECWRCGATEDLTIFSPRRLPPDNWPYLRREWPQASPPITLCDNCRYGLSGSAKPDGLAVTKWERLATSPNGIQPGQGSPQRNR